MLHLQSEMVIWAESSVPCPPYQETLVFHPAEPLAQKPTSLGDSVQVFK